MSIEQPQPSQNLNQLMLQQSSGNLSFSSSNLSKDDEEMSRSALTTFRAKEEEIEKKKLEVREKVQAHLGRVEEETKRLATIREVCSLGLLLFSWVICKFWFFSFLVQETCQVLVLGNLRFFSLFFGGGLIVEKLNDFMVKRVSKTCDLSIKREIWSWKQVQA